MDRVLAELARRRDDHDDRDERHEQDDGPSPLTQVREETSRLARRYRRQGLPLAAIAGTHMAGAAAAAATTGGGALAALAVGLAAAAGAYGYAHRHATRWNQVYAAAAAAGSVGWQVAATLAGAGGVLPTRAP